jgi:hypothetical protein
MVSGPRRDATASVGPDEDLAFLGGGLPPHQLILRTAFVVSVPRRDATASVGPDEDLAFLVGELGRHPVRGPE